MQHLAIVLAIGSAQALIRVYGLLLGLLILATALVLSLLIWLLYVCFCSRSFTPSESLPTIKDGSFRKVSLGHPFLLPTQVSHTRLGPGHYNYTVPHFLVGVPVGLRDRLGGLLSIDEPSRCRLEPDVSSPSRTQAPGLLQCPSPSPKSGLQSWFTVDAHYHLDKGVGGGLEGKLRHYLVSQGENPNDYPHAYLLTMPRFLGYQRNLVCLWYLYNVDRELKALITEVNNYWGQRKVAFCKLEGEGEPTVLPSSSKAEKVETESIYSSSQYATYHGTWNKDMFISPFEKFGGVISLRVSDPLVPVFNGKPNPLQITITLLADTGKPTLIGRVFTPEDRGHDPVDPATASSWSLLRFIPYWTAVLAITELMIIVSALWIKSKGVKMYTAPEVKRNNFPRDESGIERDLEHAFRAYLQRLVTSSTWPVDVQLAYIPSKSHYLVSQTFSAPNPSGDSPTTITIQPLTPSFYTSFPTYADALTAFKEESSFVPVDSDPHSQRLYISHPDLFFNLFKTSPSVTTGPFQTLNMDNMDTNSRPSLRRRIVSHLRKSEKEYFLNDFVEGYLSPFEQETYYAALLKHRVSEKIALGSHGLLNYYYSWFYVVFNVVISWVLFGLFLKSCSAFQFPTGRSAALTAVGLTMLCHWGVLRIIS
ncbi:uncharacterized protein BDV14DRAFT_197522 [Aspergillus stella-maris]|uniref:uncharacterized protein n=1 Tax=Aspergillus stella-maris TaxID=1810926 RepID=UPI003CCE3263